MKQRTASNFSKTCRNKSQIERIIKKCFLIGEFCCATACTSLPTVHIYHKNYINGGKDFKLDVCVKHSFHPNLVFQTYAWMVGVNVVNIDYALSRPRNLVYASHLYNIYLPHATIWIQTTTYNVWYRPGGLTALRWNI